MAGDICALHFGDVGQFAVEHCGESPTGRVEHHRVVRHPHHIVAHEC